MTHGNGQTHERASVDVDSDHCRPVDGQDGRPAHAGTVQVDPRRAKGRTLMSRMLPYRVEIYSPTNDRDLIVSFESQNPFMTISVGDTLRPSGWGKGSAEDNAAGQAR